MMNLKSFAAAVVLGLITLGGTAQAQDQGTERLNVKVGDRWVFVTRSTSGAKLDAASSRNAAGVECSGSGTQ